MAPVTSFSYLVDSFQSHCCVVTAVKNTQDQTYTRLKRHLFNFDAASPSGVVIKDALGWKFSRCSVCDGAGRCNLKSKLKGGAGRGSVLPPAAAAASSYRITHTALL